MLHESAISFWALHGLLFVTGLFFFPRLTMVAGALLGFCYSGGWLYWLGCLFVPRFTVALVATISYWHTNPWLVGFTWLWALGGEGAEKQAIRRR